MYRIPFFICALIGVYTAIYCTLGPYTIDAPAYDGLVFDTRTALTLHQQSWRWYTYSLVHANAMHLAGNAMALAFYGITLVAYDLYRWTLPIIHTVAIVNGALTMSWQYYLYGAHIIDIGASGGVYGIYAAYIPLVIYETDVWKRAQYGGIILSFSITEIVSIACAEVAVANRSHSGHIGGFIGGLFTAFAFAGDATTSNTVKWVRRVAAIMAIGVTAANIGITLYA